MHPSSRIFRAAPFVCAAVLVAACESESDPTGPGGGQLPTLNQVLIAGPLNASSNDTLLHFSLATGTIVPSTGDWDIALRRFEVRINGGVSGAKGVLGYALDNNVDATDEEVIAFTAENTLAEFDAVREAQIPVDGEFQSDRLFADEFGYLTLGGIPTANATAYWKVRTASGGHVLARVSAIVLSPPAFALTSITIETRAQNGGTLGAVETHTIAVAGAPVSIDLASGTAVQPNGCNWDFALDPTSLEMTVNTGCNVGTYPGPGSPTFANATAANDAPEYGAFLSGLTGPIPNSFTDPAAPFWYNLQGDNRLHPSFNIYLLKVGAEVYKVQLIGYYSEAGASAWPTIRYARIR